MYGHSSGAGLALHAAAHGLPITRVVLHEAPYGPDLEPDRQAAREYAETLRTLLAEGRRGDAVALFMTIAGTPPEVVDRMRREPWWPGMAALAPTLAYDSEVMGDRDRGGTMPLDLAARVGMPALVLSGGASPAPMTEIGRRLAEAMPDGWHRVLPDQELVVPPEILVPVLMEFFAG